MSIKAISKTRFDSFHPARGPMLEMIASEKSWFATEDETLIGTVMFDNGDKDWNYVVLKRAEDGKFRWVDGESSFDSQDKAEKALKRKMSAIG